MKEPHYIKFWSKNYKFVKKFVSRFFVQEIEKINLKGKKQKATLVRVCARERERSRECGG